jgi:hypothetical protein
MDGDIGIFGAIWFIPYIGWYNRTIKVPKVGMAWMAGCVGFILAGWLLGYARTLGITLTTRPNQLYPTF